MQFTEQEILEFKSECLEFLELAERSLLAVDAGESFQTHYNTIFRTFHNLKGSSAIIGLNELLECMHELENRLGAVKESPRLKKAELEYFLEGVDRAKEIVNRSGINSFSQEKTESDSLTPTEQATPLSAAGTALNEFADECTETLSRMTQSLQQIEKGNCSVELFESVYRDLHTIKGSAYLFSFKELGDLTHLFETAFEHLKQRPAAVAEDIMSALFGYLDLVEKVVLAILKNEYEKHVDNLKKFSVLVNNLNLKYSLIGNSNDNSTGVVLDSEKRISALTGDSPENESKNQPNAGGKEDFDKENNSTIRVPVLLLDKLMSLMGEIVQVRNQVVQVSNQSDDLEFLNITQRLNVVTSEMQGELMKTRMQPIGKLLNKFNRVVRDLARDLGKKIEISFSGSETELDKTLLEAIKDPLTHIIRNACDHAIEQPELRSKSGKPPTGHILVNSFHEGGQVVVEVSDDGQGLNAEKLKEKAIEKGLISNETARHMSEREAFNLIFAPGFSTAQKVTNISGRGVGMDVVKSNIEKVGGSVELDSRVGQGTSIKLRIPLTLAIVPAMIVRCRSEKYAIPQLKLEELILVENNETDRIEMLNGTAVYRLRGKILPLINLKKTFNLADELDLSVPTNIVVLKSEDYSFGLIVDEILDTADIVVKPLSRFMKTLQLYSGATVLGDGSIALILDVSGLAKSQFSLIENSKRESSVNLASTQPLELQDFLTFRLNSQTKHALLLGYVHRLEEFKKSAVETSGQQRLIRYRNSVLPLLKLNSLLQYGDASEDQLETFPVVVIEKNGLLFGLEVNEILDVLKTDKDLDTTLTDESGIVGSLVNEEEVITVVDPFRVINHSRIITSSNLAPSGTMSTIYSADANGAKNANANQRNRNLSILYVEDTAFFRKAVSKALEQAGHTVTTAKNGREGVEVLSTEKNSRFDLIISDIEMPILNGFGFAEQLRKMDHYKKAPLIALSTKADESHIRKAMGSGFDAYLEKLDVFKLLQEIGLLISKGAA